MGTLDNTNDRFSTAPKNKFSKMISVDKIPSDFWEVCFFRQCHLWTTPVIEAQSQREEWWAAPAESTVNSAVSPGSVHLLTYLQYNYFDFFVTPVEAGAGQGWGNIYKQTKVSQHQQNFVCGPDTREVKWLQTSWLWDYLELTRDVWVVWGGGHTSPHSPPPPLCPGHWAHIRWSEWVTSDPETIPDQRHVNTEHVIRQSRDSGE